MNLTFNQSNFIEAAKEGRIRWQTHAVERRLRRGISPESIIDSLIDFDVIEFYPDSYPLPSLLLMGESEGQAIHVVAAFNQQMRIIHIITIYFPDERRFESGFRTRRRDK